MTSVPAAPTTSLADLVISLHNARGGYGQFATRLAEAREAFEEQNRQLIELTASSKTLVETIERQLRIRAVEVYESTGKKQVAPGIAIRIEKVVAYDPAAALTWAKAHGLALTLDAAAFEKIAIASGVPIEGVKVSEQPKATIARDLSEAVALAD